MESEHQSGIVTVRCLYCGNLLCLAGDSARGLLYFKCRRCHHQVSVELPIHK